jgi:hypothetical protein
VTIRHASSRRASRLTEKGQGRTLASRSSEVICYNTCFYYLFQILVFVLLWSVYSASPFDPLLGNWNEFELDLYEQATNVYEDVIPLIENSNSYIDLSNKAEVA